MELGADPTDWMQMEAVALHEHSREMMTRMAVMASVVDGLVSTLTGTTEHPNHQANCDGCHRSQAVLAAAGAALSSLVNEMRAF